MTTPSGSLVIRSVDLFTLTVGLPKGPGNNQLKLVDSKADNATRWSVVPTKDGYVRIEVDGDSGHRWEDELGGTFVKLDTPDKNPAEQEWLLAEGPEGMWTIQHRKTGKFVSTRPLGVEPLPGQKFPAAGKGASLWLIEKAGDVAATRWRFEK